MRLTYHVIHSAQPVLNPEGKLTLQLRNLQIPYIENLAITQDKFQIIDLTNNELVELNNIPVAFYNLETLLLGNNNIVFIDDSLTDDNRIKSISLVNNSISKFHINFRKFKHLENLILIGNPIIGLKDYRVFMIWLVPSLKVLDFQKVKDVERKKGKELFGDDHENLNPLGLSYLNAEKATAEATTEATGSVTVVDKNLQSLGKKLTPDEKTELMKKLENADSIEEVERIERILKHGGI